MLIELQKISKAFGNPAGTEKQQVLQDLDLVIEAGEKVAVLGPSGSGKSTMLNIMGTLEQPDQGDVLFRDRDLNSYSGKELDHFRNREIGFVFQFHHLLPQCNLLENVLIPTLTDREERDKKRAYAESLMKRTGLWEHRDKMPGQLSGGECQRTAVVRAMINRPGLLLADEPTGALDGKNVDILFDLLLELNREEGVALVLVTHSERLAMKMGKIYELNEGRLFQR